MSITTLLIGVVLVVASVWWIAQGSETYISRSGISDLIGVINGILPALLFIGGLFVVWLELDELKVSQPKPRKSKK